MDNLYYSGTSNIVLPVPNKSLFPPEYQNTSRLTYYASLFNSLEVNSSFYRLPLGKTVAKWAGEVPDGFKFTFKIWQEVSHKKELAFKTDDVRRFMEVVNNCDKKGCLLLQFPPGASINLLALGDLLATIQNHNPGDSWKIAVEFRNRSWYCDDVCKLLESFNATMVIHDLPASATPMEHVDANFVYLRFHGPDSGYRGSYEDDFLAEYASYINEWLEEGKIVYVYFNNTVGAAVNNLITLNKMVAHYNLRRHHK